MKMFTTEGWQDEMKNSVRMQVLKSLFNLDPPVIYHVCFAYKVQCTVCVGFKMVFLLHVDVTRDSCCFPSQDYTGLLSCVFRFIPPFVYLLADVLAPRDSNFPELVG